MAEITEVENVGEILQEPRASTSVQWKIPNYFSFPQVVDYCITSPSFVLVDTAFYLRLYLNGESAFDSNGYIGLYVIREQPSISVHNIDYTIGIQKTNGASFKFWRDVSDFEGDEAGWGCNMLVKRQQLLRNKRQIAPDDTLTVFCVLHAKQMDSTEESAQITLRDKQMDSTEESAQIGLREEIWHSKISHIYDTKDFSDVRFLLNGHVFEAHRLLLAMRSQKFARILLSSDALDEYIVDEDTVTETGFEILLRFVYKNSLGTDNKESIIAAYHAAHYYGVEDMISRCVEEITFWEISIEEVCELLKSGLDVLVVKQKCLDFIRKYDQAILSSSSFVEINLQTLRVILENGALNKAPVFRLIESVMRWGVHHNGGDTDYSAIRKQLLESGEKPLLGRLQFQDLNLEEFPDIISTYRGLLTPEEIVCFLNYLRNKDAAVLPPWCTFVDEKQSESA